jgi:hypothetical protein
MGRVCIWLKGEREIMSPSTQRLGDDASERLWPEPLRTEPPAAEPFPWRIVGQWAIPVVVGVLVLSLAFWYFEQRAGKQIVFSDSDGLLYTVRADGSNQPEVLQITTLPTTTRFLTPRWAPREQLFATIAFTETDSPASTIPITPTFATIRLDGSMPVSTPLNGLVAAALPLDAWASDGSTVALVGFTGLRTQIWLVDPRNGQVISTSLQLRNAMMDWHPTRAELLVPSRTETTTPTLSILTPDGLARAFAPNDEQASRAMGSWLPTDGSQIAYIANSDMDSVWGQLWVANADGSAPRVLVSEGLNSLPVWSPDGAWIAFTRQVTTTENPSYELYLIDALGRQLRKIGTAAPPQWSELQPTVAWAADSYKFFFQGYDAVTRLTTLYVANVDAEQQVRAMVTEPVGRDTQSPLTVLWSPTSRRMLIAANGESMYLQDLATNGQQIDLQQQGVLPIWQP